MTIDNLAAALAQLALLPPSAARLPLACSVADAGRRHLAPIPSWVTGYLEHCLSAARLACLPKEQLVEPLLTLHLLTGREAYELEAVSIINACYRQLADLWRGGVPAATTGKNPASPSPAACCEAITRLHLVVTASDYIEDYNPGIVIDAYHHITSLLNTSARRLDSSARKKLTEIEQELAVAEAV